MEKKLTEFVEKLKAAAGANLKAVVLYGSRATGDFQEKYSDVNLLCVVERLGADELRALNPVVIWWMQQNQPAPKIFTREELGRSADVFAIELTDLKASHRVLHGEDVFAALDVPMSLHRLQVERELRTNLIRLREGFLVAPQDARSILALMTRSISSFATLFRHTLLVFGEQAPGGKREAIRRLAAQLGFDAAPFEAVLDVREGRRGEKQLDAPATFRAYLDSVTRVADEVDRRLK
jgi:hypothetical protein